MLRALRIPYRIQTRPMAFACPDDARGAIEVMRDRRDMDVRSACRDGSCEPGTEFWPEVDRIGTQIIRAAASRGGAQAARAARGLGIDSDRWGKLVTGHPVLAAHWMVR